MKKVAFILLFFLFFSGATVFGYDGGQISQIEPIAYTSQEPIEEVRDYIRKYYIETVPEHILAQPTIKKITEKLDQYTVYMSAEEFEQYSQSLNQQLVGVGIVIEEDEQGVEVITVLEGGPAAKAGMQAGDIITNVDGKNLAGLSVQTAVSYITGKENTTVTLTIYRPATKETLTKTLTRAIIQLPNVESMLLGGDIGFIRLNSFSLNAVKEIEEAIKKYPEAEGWIFDLRNNGGGYVSAAQAISGLFPNVTKAFQLKYNYKAPDIFPIIPQKTRFTEPVHLLVNSYSASASEMVAAAVKEQKGATIYGQTTYGKGTLQTLFLLSDDSLLKLTTARFYSPNGTEINKIGVAPDQETPEGMELIYSHRDHLVNKFAAYQKLPSLENVPTTKVFKIAMNAKMNWESVKEGDVQLFQLGGKEVPIDLQVVDEKTIAVAPKEELEESGHYFLVVHPNWQSQNSKKMTKGIYLEVTVE